MVSIIMNVMIIVIDLNEEGIRSEPPRGGVKIGTDDTTGTTRTALSPIPMDRSGRI